jgi:cytoskeletal protein CcmA (bactofilin family)
MSNLNESAINIVAEGTRIEGKITFDHISRVHGVLLGEVIAKDGSTLVLSEAAVIEGSIDADILMIDGYVRGDVTAKTRVVISRTGRVIGNIKTASLILEFGAHFEGQCSMEKEREKLTEDSKDKIAEKAPPTLNLKSRPALPN